MDTNKVIVILLVLTIVLSVATVAFTTLSAGNQSVKLNQERKAVATLGLYVEGGQPATEGGNVGLYVQE